MEPDRDGRYPIHYQALDGRLEDLARSLEEGVDPSVGDRAATTPLHFAAQSRNAGAVRLLLDRGADVGARNAFGATPLWTAFFNARDDDHGVIAMLLDAGADLDAENSAGVSARKLADMIANYDLKKYIPTTE